MQVPDFKPVKAGAPPPATHPAPAPRQPEWTPDQLARKARAEAGECVVASIRKKRPGERTDEALLTWAEREGLFTRIDRRTEWGNPFEMPEDGNREDVIEKYREYYIPHKWGLLKKMKTLRGRVLGCWCHPEPCHGHVIAEIVNQEAGAAPPEALS
jgi:hypothetical protein